MSDTASINELYCPQCGYDLRAIESARCPECGLTIDRTNLGESIIPWLHREKLGRYRAFWRTVNLATFRSRKLGREMNCPARFEDAVKFRRFVVLHAWAPLAAIALFAAIELMDTNDIWISRDVPGSIVQVIDLAFWALCLALYLFVISGVASYWFQTRNYSVVPQNRAIALSYYGCAPLAFTVITVPIAAAAVWFLAEFNQNLPVILFGAVLIVGFAPIIAQLVLIVGVPVALLAVTTLCSRLRRIVLTLSLPMMALFFAALLLYILPVAEVVISLIPLSLRR